MIRRLRLTNWKAYENLDLSLGTGATFIVAQNGIGKSSLMQGLVYGLYGAAALGFPPEEAIRAGARSSTAQVTVELPNGGMLNISRTLSAPKRPGRFQQKVNATLNDDPINGEQMTTALTEQFGASLDQLPLLTVLREGDVLRDGDSAPAFNVVTHLSSMLGVDRAKSAASRLDRLEGHQSRAGDAIRRDDPGKEAIAELHERSTALSKTLTVLRDQFSTNSESLRKLQRLLDQAKAWHSFKTAQAIDNRRVAANSVDVQSLLAELARIRPQIIEGQPNGPATQSFDSLDSIHRTVDHALSFLRSEELRSAEERSAAAALLSRAQTARDSLQGAGALCPTCRRPISLEEAQTAISVIDNEISELRRQLASGQSTQSELESLAQRFDSIRSQFDQTAGQGPGEPEPAEPVSVLEDLVQKQQALCDEVRLEGLRLRDVLAEVDKQISEYRDLDRANKASVRAYRQSMIAKLSASTLRGVAQSLCAEQIDPIARELHKRWEQLWPATTDLHLDPDGQLLLRLGDETVKFHHFSGGEKTMAVIMLRMLALQMLTKAGFLILDEPLEHLDPRNRRMVAKLLVAASGSGPFEQVIVTTYEESVARALGSNAMGSSIANVIYVKAHPVQFGTTSRD